MRFDMPLRDGHGAHIVAFGGGDIALLGGTICAVDQGLFAAGKWRQARCIDRGSGHAVIDATRGEGKGNQ
jgi:hypothetical protein